MRARALLLLLLAAVCAATDVSPNLDARPALKENLASLLGQQAAAAVRLNSADYYGKDHVCFEAANTCGFFLGYTPKLFRSQLTCCKHDAPYERSSATKDFLPPSETGPKVGTCTLSFSDSPLCLILGRNSYTCGLWSLSCNLHGDAGACGPHDCADLVLTAEGQSVAVGVAVVEGPRPTPILAPSDADDIPFCQACYIGENIFGDENQCSYGSRRSGENSTAAPSSPLTSLNLDKIKELIEQADTQRVATANNDPWKKINLALGVNYISGPVTISSKHHDTKWKEGWVEYMFATYVFKKPVPAFVADIIESKLGEKLLRVDYEDFNKYEFTLFKDGPKHY